MVEALSKQRLPAVRTGAHLFQVIWTPEEEQESAHEACSGEAEHAFLGFYGVLKCTNLSVPLVWECQVIDWFQGTYSKDWGQVASLTGLNEHNFT